jgi:hypothetical protein
MRASIIYKARSPTLKMLDEIPDEYLSYSELKDRIREECARALPKKERVLLMAQKLEEDLTLKETICDHICTDLKDDG